MARDNILVLTDRLEAQLRSALGEPGIESAAFVLATPAKTASRWRWVAREVIPVEASEYSIRSAVEVELPPIVVANAAEKARQDPGTSVLLAHSHTAGSARPSPRDREGEEHLIPFLFRRVPPGPHGRIIVAPDEIHAAILLADGSESPLKVISVGRDIRVLSAPEGAPEPSRPTSEDVYARQILAFGQLGQRAISALRVGVVGLGGTGSILVEQLSYLGVREFLLIDPDSVEQSNLNRIVGATASDVGEEKVHVAARSIKRVNASSQVQAVVGDVVDVEIGRRLLDCDFIFCCTDSHGSRHVLNQVAHQFAIPVIDTGVSIDPTTRGIRATGRIQMLAAGLPCLVCGGVLDSEAVRRDLQTEEARKNDLYIRGGSVAQPAVVTLNGAVVSFAATMFMAAVTHLPFQARHQLIRFEKGETAAIGGKPSEDCPICSSAGAALRADTWPFPGRGALPREAFSP